MKTRYCLISLVLITLIFFSFTEPLTTSAAHKIKSGIDSLLQPRQQFDDPRAQILYDYLTKYNSTLKNQAQDFVDAADTYNIDWKLVTAIAGAESTFARRIPGGHNQKTTSYNAWGWGVYGDKVIRFKSWREAIFAVSKGLKERFIDQGLTDPYLMNKKYAADPNWGKAVSYFLWDMDSFSKNHPDYQKLIKVPNAVYESIFPNDAYLKVENHQFKLIIIE